MKHRLTTLLPPPKSIFRFCERFLVQPRLRLSGYSEKIKYSTIRIPNAWSYGTGTRSCSFSREHARSTHALRTPLRPPRQCFCLTTSRRSDGASIFCRNMHQSYVAGYRDQPLMKFAIQRRALQRRRRRPHRLIDGSQCEYVGIASTSDEFVSGADFDQRTKALNVAKGVFRRIQFESEEIDDSVQAFVDDNRSDFRPNLDDAIGFQHPDRFANRITSHAKAKA